ncbi:MAG TPA: 6-bladed beta-propeller [Gemmatimonadales bacterium]|jgi:hypothetical protein|nr:6-bladed beta-propeller [Gemmatimonadales bacterium]
MNSRILPGFVVLFACSRPAIEVAESVAVRDSAGVQILEHLAGSEERLPKWMVAEAPLLDIGEGDGPGQDLYQVGGAVRLGDGRIVVVNRGSNELRFFDSTGAYLFAAGRQGQGPGEFASLGTIQLLPGDSLFALDPQLRRGSLFAPTGEFVRSMTTGQRADLEAGRVQGYTYAIALLDQGRLLGESRLFTEMKKTSGPVRRDTFALVFLDPDGSSADTIAVIPGGEVFPALGHEGGHSFPTIHSLEFGRQTVVAIDRERIYVGTNEPDGIRVYSSNGKLIRKIRSASPAELVTAEHRETRMREALARIDRQRGSEQVKAEWRKNQENARYAEVFPFYERLLIGTDGALWVERARRYEDEGRRFIVYDSTGRAIATVSCPERVRPYHVGPAEIIGLWRDPDEVPHVRVYKVRGER